MRLKYITIYKPDHFLGLAKRGQVKDPAGRNERRHRGKDFDLCGNKKALRRADPRNALQRLQSHVHPRRQKARGEGLGPRRVPVLQDYNPCGH